MLMLFITLKKERESVGLAESTLQLNGTPESSEPQSLLYSQRVPASLLSFFLYRSFCFTTTCV